MLLAAYGNITDFQTNEAFVRHVLAMDTTNFDRHAIRASALQTGAYCLIIAWEAMTGLCLLAGAWQWMLKRTAQARAMSTVGLLMSIR